MGNQCDESGVEAGSAEVSRDRAIGCLRSGYGGSAGEDWFLAANGQVNASARGRDAGVGSFVVG